MKRPSLPRLRLQHCVWMLGAALSSSACGPAERVPPRGDPVQVDTAHADTRDDDLVDDSTAGDDPTADGRQTPAIEDGAFVRGDDRTDEMSVQGPEDTLSPPLSAADEATLLAQIAADVTAIQQLHVVGATGATPACDESSCVYFCDEICLDLDPRDQAARVATLRALTERARAVVDDVALSDADWSDGGASAQVEQDLLALSRLAVLDGLSFDDAADECPSCYQFTIDEMNIRRRLALHNLVDDATIELAPTETE